MCQEAGFSVVHILPHTHTDKFHEVREWVRSPSKHQRQSRENEICAPAPDSLRIGQCSISLRAASGERMRGYREEATERSRDGKGGPFYKKIVGVGQ